MASRSPPSHLVLDNDYHSYPYVDSAYVCVWGVEDVYH